MKPLQGVKVVELGTHIAVPLASRLLSDWGAQVIKVENPTGDLWRYYGMNVRTPISDEENPLFSIPNANKKIVSLNLKEEEGRRVLFQLLEDADVFMTNVRMKGLKGLGLDYESLSGRFPKLVYFHFTGYGYQGPWASRPGFDIAAFWSAGGMIGSWTKTGAMPFAPASAFGDATVASMAASGVLAGLLGSRSSGKGCYLTTSLYATAMWYNFGDVISCQPQYGLVRPAPREDNRNYNPFMHPYPCKDGKGVYLAALEFERNYAKCLRVLEMEEYLGDERYNTLPAYIEHSEEFTEKVKAKMLTRSAAEWVERFGAVDIVIQEILTGDELYRCEQAWAEGILTNVEFPSSGHITAMPNTPVKFMGEELPHTHAVGGIGCDTREVLSALGYSQEGIDALARRGVVRMPD